MAHLTATATVDEVCETLERDGYAIVEGVLSAEEVAAKKADLLRILESTRTGRNDFEGFDTRRIYALFAKTPRVRRAGDAPAGAGRARPCAGAVPAERAAGHPDRRRARRRRTCTATTASTRWRGRTSSSW